MTSIVGWRQAFESAVMAGSDNLGRTRIVRTVNRNRRSLELALAGAAFGALALGSPAIAADMPLKAPHLRPAFDWSGFYIGGHTGYGRGSSSAMLSDPRPFRPTGSVFSGVIGGVQGGYNVQLPSGLVLGVEADLTFPNYLISNSIVATLTGARSDVVEELGLCRHRARPPRLCQRALAGLRHRRFRLRRRALRQYARRRPDEKHINVRPGWAAGAGVEYAFAPHWSVQARISLHPVRPRQCPLPLGGAIQFDARLPADAHRPQPQDRLAGIATAGRRRPT